MRPIVLCRLQERSSPCPNIQRGAASLPQVTPLREAPPVHLLFRRQLPFYGAPDCSEFSVERLSISRRPAAKESSDQRSAAPPGRPYVNLRGNIFTLIEEAQRRLLELFSD